MTSRWLIAGCRGQLGHALGVVQLVDGALGELELPVERHAVAFHAGEDEVLPEAPPLRAGGLTPQVGAAEAP